MFASLRPITRVSARAFSTSRSAADYAKLSLIGRLVSDGVVRTTKNGKEFMVYKVATTDPYIAPKEGEAAVETTSWHSIFAYGTTMERIQKIERGSLVYVEANFTVQNEKTDSGEFKTTIFAKHEKIQVIRRPASHSTEAETAE